MSATKLETGKLDEILKKTVEVINSSKDEIFEISENARKNCKQLERELVDIKQKVVNIIDSVEALEADLKESKRRLVMVSKNFDKYSQEELKKAYESADIIRIELAVKREQEQNILRTRNDLEIRIKEAYKAVEKADNLISSVGMALGYLTGDLLNITNQLDELQEKELFGTRIIKAQEEERQRVAREVHDGPAQSMSNVVLKAEICEKLIDVDILKAKEELRSLKKVVRDSLRDVRRIIYDLRPMSLDDLGLIPTLQRYISTIQEESTIQFGLKYKGFDMEISSVLTVAAFRIVQEAINNIKKHSKAKRVSVNLETINNFLKIYIIDDGVGFDTSELKSRKEDINSGFGVMSMKERVSLLNGSFEIRSTVGKGTVVSVNIPIYSKEEV